MTALLEADGLSVAFAGRTVVDDVSFAVAAGEALGVVGGSGSGKSLSMLALLRLLPPGAHGRFRALRWDGADIAGLKGAAFDRLRGRQVAMVFQDPMAALNPVLTAGRQVGEVVRRHFGATRAAALRRAEDLLGRVGIADPGLRLRQYPHEMSGGMRQRVMIAAALAGEPRLLIADEPTTALDVTVQAEITALVKRLQREQGMAVIWVTHDLALLARIADRVVVMQSGRVVETAAVDDLFARPAHAATRALLAAAGA